MFPFGALPQEMSKEQQKSRVGGDFFLKPSGQEQVKVDDFGTLKSFRWKAFHTIFALLSSGDCIHISRLSLAKDCWVNKSNIAAEHEFLFHLNKQGFDVKHWFAIFGNPDSFLHLFAYIC